MIHLCSSILPPTSPVCLPSACLPASRHYVGCLDTGHRTLDIQPGVERSGHLNTPTTSTTPNLTPPTFTVSTPKASSRLREHSPLPSPAPQRQTFLQDRWQPAGPPSALSPACRYGSDLANHPPFPCRVVCTPNGGPLFPACPAICLAFDRSARGCIRWPCCRWPSWEEMVRRGACFLSLAHAPCMHTTMHQGCLFWPGIWCPRDPVDIGFREGLC